MRLEIKIASLNDNIVISFFEECIYSMGNHAHIWGNKVEDMNFVEFLDYIYRDFGDSFFVVSLFDNIYVSCFGATLIENSEAIVFAWSKASTQNAWKSWLFFLDECSERGISKICAKINSFNKRSLIIATRLQFSLELDGDIYKGCRGSSYNNIERNLYAKINSRHL